jgi:hypothetical protein
MSVHLRSPLDRLRDLSRRPEPAAPALAHPAPHRGAGRADALDVTERIPVVDLRAAEQRPAARPAAVPAFAGRPAGPDPSTWWG